MVWTRLCGNRRTGSLLADGQRSCSMLRGNTADAHQFKDFGFSMLTEAWKESAVDRGGASRFFVGQTGSQSVSDINQAHRELTIRVRGSATGTGA